MGIFEGKVAIITGGGKAMSIGYGIATAYAKEGANLVLTGRNEQKLLDAKEELERLYGIKVLPMQADVTPDEESEDTVKRVVEKTIEEFGRIDVLINNAQASASGIPLSMQTKDHFDLGIYSGLYATVLSPSEGDTGICDQLCFRSRAVRKRRPVLIRCCKRGNQRTFQSCGNGVGQR